MACSNNGIDYVLNKNILKDLIKNECQASGDIIRHDDKYIMIFSYRNIFDYKNTQQGYKNTYAISEDLLIGKDLTVKLNLLESFDFDKYSQSYLSTFNINEKTYVLYQGDELGKYGIGIGELEFC